MFDTIQNKVQNERYKYAMSMIKIKARRAITDGDFEYLSLLAEELQALAECDSEYEYNDPDAQEWAQLENN